MVRKLLYIIKGEHTEAKSVNADETWVYRNDEALACQKVQIELIAEIARRTGCTTYFSDGIDEETAKFTNGLLEEIVNSGGEVIFERIHQFCRIESAYSELIDIFKQFAELWKEGIKIKYHRTEDEFDELEVLRGKIPERDYVLANLYVLKGGNLDDLHRSDKLWPAFMEHRDRNIFENVSAQARDVNILFVGRDHELYDFCKEGDEFTIYEVEVKHNEGVEIEGILPINFEGFITCLSNRYQLTDKLNYDA